MFSLKLTRLIIKQYLISLYLLLINSKLACLLKICHKPQIKFIVISRSRTGSTMLMKHLKLLPHSLIVGELLGRSKKFILWNKFLKLFYNYHWKKINIVGFKYFYYHPVDNENLRNNVIKFLHANQEIKIIHLIRKDLLAVILSKAIAEETGQWSKKTRGAELKPFEIDINYFRNELKTTIKQINSLNKEFSKRGNLLNIAYEEIINETGMAKVLQFLDLSNKKVLEINTSGRQKSSNKYKMITNFEQLKKVYEQEVKNFSNYS